MHDYKGHRVEVTTYQSGQAYGVEVIVKTGHGATETHVRLPPPPATWSAASEEDARDYGLAQAKAWIDRNS